MGCLLPRSVQVIFVSLGAFVSKWPARSCKTNRAGRRAKLVASWDSAGPNTTYVGYI